MRVRAQSQYINYWHNWADDDGVTHFTLCNLTDGWIKHSFGPGQAPIFTNTLNSSALTWGYTPYQWNPTEFYHANPVVQFVVWLTGQMKFQAGDGTVVYIGPGDVYFGDDVGSQGHHSQNVGYGPAVSAVVQYSGPLGQGPCWLSNLGAWVK